MDGEGAEAWVGAARVQLGVLKNQMNLGGLAQGVLTKQWPDGTIIRVESRFGQDKISINASSSGLGKEALLEAPELLHKEPKFEEPAPTYEDVLAGGAVIAGHCTDYATNIRYAVVWRGGAAPMNLGFLPGGNFNTTNDISEDTQFVVGTCRVGNGQHAWKWSLGTGMVDLGAIPGATGSRNMIATSVSADGSVIVGSGTGASATQTVWVWTAATGAVELDSGIIGSAPKVSPNGRYITLRDTNDIVKVYQRVGTRWALMAAIPSPGTTSPGLGIVADSRPVTDINHPVNINDAGLVTGRTSHYDVMMRRSSTTFWDQGDGVPVPFESGVEAFSSWIYQTVLPSVTPVFTFDATTGVYTTLGNIGNAESAADKKFVVVGNDQRGTLGNIEIRAIPPEAPPDSLSRVIEYDLYVAIVPWAWFWTPGRGKSMLGPNTVAYDIAEDGSVVVGGVVVGASTQPAFWVPGGGAHMLTRPSFAPDTGEARCVAGVQVAVSTNPGVSPTVAA